MNGPPSRNPPPVRGRWGACGGIAPRRFGWWGGFRLILGHCGLPHSGEALAWPWRPSRARGRHPPHNAARPGPLAGPLGQQHFATSAWAQGPAVRETTRIRGWPPPGRGLSHRSGGVPAPGQAWRVRCDGPASCPFHRPHAGAVAEIPGRSSFAREAARNPAEQGAGDPDRQWRAGRLLSRGGCRRRPCTICAGRVLRPVRAPLDACRAQVARGHPGPGHADASFRLGFFLYVCTWNRRRKDSGQGSSAKSWLPPFPRLAGPFIQPWPRSRPA